MGRNSKIILKKNRKLTKPLLSGCSITYSFMHHEHFEFVPGFRLIVFETLKNFMGEMHNFQIAKALIVALTWH